jgi:predicted porin
VADADGSHGDNQVYGAGLTYEVEPWTVGFGWTRGDYAAGGASGEDRHDDFAATASYALAPGIAMDALVEFSDYRSRNEQADLAGLAVGVGLAIEF